MARAKSSHTARMTGMKTNPKAQPTIGAPTALSQVLGAMKPKRPMNINTPPPGYNNSPLANDSMQTPVPPQGNPFIKPQGGM